MQPAAESAAASLAEALGCPVGVGADRGRGVLFAYVPEMRHHRRGDVPDSWEGYAVYAVPGDPRPAA